MGRYLLIILTAYSSFLYANVVCSIAGKKEFNQDQFNFSDVGPIYGSSRNLKTINATLSKEDFLRLTESKIKNDFGNFSVNLIYDTKTKSIIYLIGEAHVKNQKQKTLGVDIVSKFRIRAAEGLQYKAENSCMSGPMKAVMRLYSDFSGLLRPFGLQGSTIIDAYNSQVKITCKDLHLIPQVKDLTLFVPIECGEFKNVPQGVCKLGSSTKEEDMQCENFLVDQRNSRMAKNTINLLSSVTPGEPILLIAGKNHINGVAGILAQENRFKIISECWSEK
jgi:hypothetical protein